MGLGETACDLLDVAVPEPAVLVGGDVGQPGEHIVNLGPDLGGIGCNTPLLLSLRWRLSR